MNRSGRRGRIQALARKETRQLLRDRSNLAIGLVLPVVLILLFGFGLSFDLTGVKWPWYRTIIHPRPAVLSMNSGGIDISSRHSIPPCRRRNRQC